MSGFAPLLVGKAAQALAVSVSSTTANRAGSSATQTSTSITGTASGGTAPYTYAWAWVSGGAGITILTPAGSSTAFSATGLGVDEQRTGTAQLTVTDNVGAVVQSALVSVSLKRIGTG